METMSVKPSPRDPLGRGVEPVPFQLIERGGLESDACAGVSIRFANYWEYVCVDNGLDAVIDWGRRNFGNGFDAVTSSRGRIAIAIDEPQTQVHVTYVDCMRGIILLASETEKPVRVGQHVLAVSLVPMTGDQLINAQRSARAAGRDNPDAKDVPGFKQTPIWRACAKFSTGG